MRFSNKTECKYKWVPDHIWSHGAPWHHQTKTLDINTFQVPLEAKHETKNPKILVLPNWADDNI